MNVDDDILNWKLTNDNTVIRGNEDTSEDQVANAVTFDVARRMVACWNYLHGISTGVIEAAIYEQKSNAKENKCQNQN